MTVVLCTRSRLCNRTLWWDSGSFCVHTIPRPTVSSHCPSPWWGSSARYTLSPTWQVAVRCCCTGSGSHHRVTPTGGCRESGDYLLGLLKKLHSLVQDLAVKLTALPQDLPPHLLHSSPQILPLGFSQRFARPPSRVLLQGIIQRGFQLLDFLRQPKSHTDRLPFEPSKHTTHPQLEEKASEHSRGQEGGRTQTRDRNRTESSSHEQWGAFHTQCAEPPSTSTHPADFYSTKWLISSWVIGLLLICDKTPRPPIPKITKSPKTESFPSVATELLSHSTKWKARSIQKKSCEQQK